MNQTTENQALLDQITDLKAQLAETKAHLKQLERTQQTYQYIINQTHEGFLRMNSDLIIVDLNQSALKLLGNDRDQIIGQRLDHFYQKESVVFLSASRDHLSIEATFHPLEKPPIPLLLNRTAYYDANQVLEGYIAFLIDLTELKTIQQKKEVAENQYRHIYENAVQGMFQTTLSGKIINVNPAYARILGYQSSDELIGKETLTHQFYASTEDRDQMIAALIKHRKLVNYEVKLIRVDGDTVWVLANVRLVTENSSDPVIEGILIDNSEKKLAEEQLRQSEAKFRQLAIIDGLTGLYNTRHLYNRLDDLIDQHTLNRSPFSLIFMDMDNFKRVVDTHGHLNGSRSLYEVAKTIEACLERPSFGVAYGGDEFVIVLPGYDRNAALEKAREIQTQMKQTHYLAKWGLKIHLTASFGFATFPNDATDRTTLLALADQAMFRVKSQGKDAVKSSHQP